MKGLQSCGGVVQCAKPVLRTLPASASRGRRSFCLPLCCMAGSKRNPNIIKEYPSQPATQLASSLSGLGQIYNDGNDSNDFPACLEESVHIHSMALPGLVSSLEVRFASPGETLSIRHVTDLKALMPGLTLPIQRVVRPKSLVYGLKENFVGP